MIVNDKGIPKLRALGDTIRSLTNIICLSIENNKDVPSGIYGELLNSLSSFIDIIRGVRSREYKRKHKNKYHAKQN